MKIQVELELNEDEINRLVRVAVLKAIHVGEGRSQEWQNWEKDPTINNLIKAYITDILVRGEN